MCDTKDECPETRGSLDQNDPAELLLAHQLLTIPILVRAKIWEHLGPADLKALRQVCPLLKADIEETVGVDAFVQKDGTSAYPLKLKWLRSVLVRTLTLSSLTASPAYRDIQLRDPAGLSRLVLLILNSQLGNGGQVKGLKRILGTSKAITSLKVSLLQDTESPLNLGFLTTETFKCLATKSRLTQLDVTVYGKRVIGQGFLVNPDPAHKPPHPFPVQLHSISLQLRMLSRKQLLDWKGMLDSQYQLRDANFCLHRVSWHFYEGVIQNCAGSLKNLVIMSWVPRAVVYKDEDLRIEYHDDVWVYGVRGPPGPYTLRVMSYFDWSVLAETRLKMLFMIFRDGEPALPPPFLLPHAVLPTKNFEMFPLQTLESLCLEAVQLSTEDLTRILMGGLSLTSIKITNWSRPMSPAEHKDHCLRHGIRIWILIAIVLPSRTFERFYLADLSLDGSPKCISSTVLELVAGPNRDPSSMFTPGTQITLDRSCIDRRA